MENTNKILSKEDYLNKYDISHLLYFSDSLAPGKVRVNREKSIQSQSPQIKNKAIDEIKKFFDIKDLNIHHLTQNKHRITGSYYKDLNLFAKIPANTLQKVNESYKALFLNDLGCHQLFTNIKNRSKRIPPKLKEILQNYIFDLVSNISHAKHFSLLKNLFIEIDQTKDQNSVFYIRTFQNFYDFIQISPFIGFIDKDKNTIIDNFKKITKNTIGYLNMSYSQYREIVNFLAPKTHKSSSKIVAYLKDLINTKEEEIGEREFNRNVYAKFKNLGNGEIQI